MAKQIEFSTSPTSESFSEHSEKSQTSSFYDILPPHCITTADRSANTYYGRPKFKGGIRRFTEPAISTTAKIDTTYMEQAEKSSPIRRSTLQTPTMRSLMKVKSSKKDGSAILSRLRLFSKSSKKRDEEDRKDTVYECDSDDGIGTFEEHKASL